MDKNTCTEHKFLTDVAAHEMTIVRDENVNRHLVFRYPGYVVHAFDIVTWHNHLCISGDMGTYVFSRLPDMFEFFRTDRGVKTLCINLGYWAEKVLAQDKHSPIEEYRPEIARRQILEYLKDSEAPRGVLKAVKEDVFPSLYDGEFEIRRLLDTFEYEYNDSGVMMRFQFQDTWEWNLRDYSYHFVWCCYAIAWAIQQYDEAKSRGVHT